ncbi:MAG: hypothetical protein ACREPR_02870, partial [Brasilonema sp.]
FNYPNYSRMAGSINILLDTCALIWWSLDPDKLSKRAIISLFPNGTGKEWSSSINNSLGNSYQGQKS